MAGLSVVESANGPAVQPKYELGTWQKDTSPLYAEQRTRLSTT